MKFPSGGHEISPDGIRQPDRYRDGRLSPPRLHWCAPRRESVKRTEEIMEILAAYDLTGSFRDAAALVGCDHHTVARYVRARDAGQVSTALQRRDQRIDPFREKVEEWVDTSHGRVRADVAHRKLEAMGYDGSERTTRRALAEANIRARIAPHAAHRSNDWPRNASGCTRCRPSRSRLCSGSRVAWAPFCRSCSSRVA